MSLGPLLSRRTQSANVEEGGGDSGADIVELPDLRYCNTSSLANTSGARLEASIASPSWLEKSPFQLLAPVDKDLTTCFHPGRSRNSMRMTLQSKVYNFLERPTGWKCFIYHFSV